MTDTDGDNKPLKSLIDNSSPLNEILRAQCKYAAHILVTFTKRYDESNDKELESIAEWSLILDDNNTKISSTKSIYKKL